MHSQCWIQYKNDFIDDDNCSRQQSNSWPSIKNVQYRYGVCQYLQLNLQEINEEKSACPSISSGKDLSSWSQIFSRLLYHVKKWQRYAILRRKQFPVSGTRSRQFFLTFFVFVISLDACLCIVWGSLKGGFKMLF